MYENFYRLDRPPFANVPDPGFLFLSAQHQRALAVLQYALMARAGFCVITGNVGAGKTTLVRRLLQTLDQPVEIGLVSNTSCDTFEEFLRWILLAFDLEYRGLDKVEMYDSFVRYMIQQYEKGRPVTLIIDEAQHLAAKHLEELRMLSNVNTERGQILQTILVGQPELWDLLRTPELSQFAQRISYDYFLPPLESAEVTGAYVRHRLKNAGGSEDLFLPETSALIHSATGGVPRLINLVCDTALVYGYAEEAEHIDQALIERVLADKESGFSPIGARRRIGDVGPTADGSRDVGPTADGSRNGGTPRPKSSTIERAAARLRKT